MTGSNKIILLCSFFFGMISRLYLLIPFGYVGMFDLFCYGLAPFLYFIMASDLSRREHVFLSLILLWIVGNFLANSANGFSSRDIFKAFGITSSMWCMSVVCLFVLKKNLKSVIFFIMGTYIGATLSLYAFQNGAYMEFAVRRGYSSGYMGEFMELKQILPVWLGLFTVSGGIAALLLWKRFPRWIIIAGFFGVAFVGLFEGGSRTTFGVNIAVSILAFGVFYSKTLVRSVLKNFQSFVIVATITITMMFALYAYLASAGILGEDDKIKYEDEYGDKSGLVEGVGARGGFDQTWKDFKKKPFGSGGVGALRHSALMDSIYKDGLFAVPFWAFLMLTSINFFRMHLIKFDQWSPFIGMFIIVVLWNALASPFGARGSYCLIAALATYSSNPEFTRQLVIMMKGESLHGHAKTHFRNYS